MKISASVYAHGESEIDKTVHSLEQIGVDYFHVDCNDDPAVFQEIDIMKKHSQKPIDLHIITKTPAQYFQLIERHQPHFVCFQFEELPQNFAFPAIEGVQFGLGIRTETPIEVFEKFENQCSFLLIMATVPGQSGGKFDPENFKKIRAFMRRFPKKNIVVDGGVNAEVSFILRSYGVQTAVVGSYLAKSNKRAVTLNMLKHETVESHYTVGDMMVSRAHLPIVLVENCSVETVLKANEGYRLGYTLVENNKQELVGISTNADLRRALLKKLNNFAELEVSDFINYNPKSITENTTVKEMLEMLRKSEYFISYMPVVNDKNILKGAINLHFLIKGEL